MAELANLPVNVKSSQRYHSTFTGEKLVANDLKELGLEHDPNPIQIQFDNEKSIRYSLCFFFLVSLCTIILLPFYIIFYPFIKYSLSFWIESRIAAVTDKKLVLKQSYYGCCCCCLNEKTKSVPLNMITDLSIQQGCIQRLFNIKEINVETASCNEGEPELRLIGLKEPHQIRSMILKVRDKHVQNYNQNPNNSNQNKQIKQLLISQNQTMVEISDVLKDMKTALFSMNSKMN